MNRKTCSKKFMGGMTVQYIPENKCKNHQACCHKMANYREPEKLPLLLRQEQMLLQDNISLNAGILGDLRPHKPSLVHKQL